MKLRLPQFLLAAAVLVSLMQWAQAQDESTPLGDVARKTKIEASKEKPKITLDEYNTSATPAAATASPVSTAAQVPAAPQPGSTATPSAIPCFDTCDGPPSGKTPLESAQKKVKFYADAVADDNSAISDIQKQLPDEKDVGRLQGLKDALSARTKALGADQKALDDAKAELAAAQDR